MTHSTVLRMTSCALLSLTHTPINKTKVQTDIETRAPIISTDCLSPPPPRPEKFKGRHWHTGNLAVLPGFGQSPAVSKEIINPDPPALP